MKQTAPRKRALALLALTAFSMVAVACNTVQGLGRDIESVGRKGEEVIN
ncbi:MAG: entericidin A/B family lipoprotein [Erythrobacter sp.]|nr:entericidin A/B family lipoprotein [Erythrobacter sp.]